MDVVKNKTEREVEKNINNMSKATLQAILDSIKTLSNKVDGLSNQQSLMQTQLNQHSESTIKLNEKLSEQTIASGGMDHQSTTINDEDENS